MKNAYPIIMTPAGEGGFVVSVPDFDINTQGDDECDAILMARDAIGIMGIDMEDDRKELPIPSPLSALNAAEGQLITLVDVDFVEYRKKHCSRAVKKNCSIPEWLNNAAQEKGINFSQVLQDALKEKLGY